MPVRRPPVGPRRIAVAVIEAVEARQLLSAVAPSYVDRIGLTGAVSAETTFEDNFDGVALDATKWQVREGARNRAVKDGPVETITYTSGSAVEVSNGELTLHAYNDPVTGRVTTGWIQTNNTQPGVKVGSPVAPATLLDGYSGNFNQAYGVWEARIKFNSMPGEWGAFWVHAGQVASVIDASQVNHPEIYGTEMDVAENGAIRQGVDVSGQVSTIVHANGYVQYATDQTVHTTTATLGPTNADPSQYHVYTLYWTPTAAKFYVDGNLVNNVTDPNKVSKVAQYIILSTEAGAGGSLLPGTGSNYFGTIPDGGYGDLATSQAKMTVDYVRVWALANPPANPPPTTPHTDPTTLPPPSTGVTVGGAVFNDANGNGKQDAGEAGVANATIYLDLNYNGKQDSTEPATATDATGAYRFANAPVASFGVTLAKSALFAPTTPSSGQIAMRAAVGQSYLNRHFAVKLTATDTTPPTVPTPPTEPPPTTTPPPTIPPVIPPPPPPVTPTPVPSGSAAVGGVIYVDLNGNGKQDAGEAGVAGALVYLDLNYNGRQDATEPTATTEANGLYRFDNVPAASFGVTLAKSPLFAPTAPSSGQIAMRAAAGQSYLNRHFGVKLIG